MDTTDSRGEKEARLNSLKSLGLERTPELSSIVDNTFEIVAVGRIKGGRNDSEKVSPFWSAQLTDKCLPEIVYVLGRMGPDNDSDIAYVGRDRDRVLVEQIPLVGFPAVYSFNTLETPRLMTLSGVNTTILIVGDPSYFAPHKKAIEEQLGCRIDMAETVEQAGDMERRREYDLVIVERRLDKEAEESAYLALNLEKKFKPLIETCDPGVWQLTVGKQYGDNTHPIERDASQPKDYIRLIRELLPNRFVW